MRLYADRVDWRTRPLHALQQIEQDGTAGFVLGRVEFDIVFVDDEAGLRVGFPRGAVGEVEIFGPEGVEEYGLAQPVRSSVLGLDRLVDDVPAVNDAAIASGERLDPVDDRAPLRITAG